MKLPVRDLLNERTAPLRGRARLLTVVASIAVHVFLVVAFVFAPMLSADDDEMPEYVAVQIVPAQMLGTSTPVDPSPRPVREDPPAETTLPEPEPEPEQQEEAPPPKPTVPDPESRRPPQQQAPAPRRVQARETGALQQREGSPTGNPLGTSNFGAAVGFDNPDFTYDYYVDSMLAAIRPYWARPSIGGTVEAMVSFRILKDGRAVDISIAQSSGYNSFDLAALRAVQAASPLPKLPQSFRHNSLGVTLVVR